MRTTLVAVGKLRPSFREASDEYLTRIRRYSPFEEREIREAGRAPTPTARQREETARIAAALPPGATVVLLDRGGSGWTSEELARKLDGWRGSGRAVALVIGGAFGLDPAGLVPVLTRWSLGPLTLAHELARVVVLEQWYRAWTILRGEPYHK
jgi:23S rRNA (pseudouridine1915-N3)-methyltransferase